MPTIKLEIPDATISPPGHEALPAGVRRIRVIDGPEGYTVSFFVKDEWIRGDGEE